MRSPRRSPARGGRGPSDGSPIMKVLVLAAVALVVVVMWAAWPAGYSPSRAFSGGDHMGELTKERLMQALIKENRRLSAGCGEPDPVLAAASVGTNAAQVDQLQVRVAELEAENTRLRASLNDAKAALSQASQALSLRGGASNGASTAVVPAAAAGSGPLPVASCAHQKLEFLRWQTDKHGQPLWCPFTPENYDNWTKMPPLCDYISIECLGRGNLRSAHVFGFGGPGLMIGIADQLMWEFVFARHKSHRHMVELGTMTGGTSLYFGVAARTRGGQFHTFDRSENRAMEIRRAWLDNMHFHKEDILTGRTAETPNTEVVKVLDVGEPIIALFDNGDKTRETNFYARYLAVGSVLLLHDWEHLDLPKPHWEMTYKYVKKELEARGFVKAYHDFAEHIGSSTRAFIRRQEGPL